MIAALESLNKLPAAAGFAAAAIACIKQEQSGQYQALARQFRQANIPCEVFLEAADGKPLVPQFVLAEKKGLRWVIIPGDNPSSDPVTLRDIVSRQNREKLSVAEAVQIMTKEPS
jgi:histidyl-tRNA synthetase